MGAAPAHARGAKKGGVTHELANQQPQAGCAVRIAFQRCGRSDRAADARCRRDLLAAPRSAGEAGGLRAQSHPLCDAGVSRHGDTARDRAWLRRAVARRGAFPAVGRRSRSAIRLFHVRRRLQGRPAARLSDLPRAQAALRGLSGDRLRGRPRRLVVAGARRGGSRRQDHRAENEWRCTQACVRDGRRENGDLPQAPWMAVWHRGGRRAPDRRRAVPCARCRCFRTMPQSHDELGRGQSSRHRSARDHWCAHTPPLHAIPPAVCRGATRDRGQRATYRG